MMVRDKNPFSNSIKFGFHLVPYLVCLIVALTPLQKGVKAIWDGTIIDYSIKNADFSGLKSWLMSSGWDVQYFLIRCEYIISNKLNISFSFLNSFILLISFGIILNEIRIFCQKNLALATNISIMTQIVFSILPIWAVTISTVMTFHVTALAAGIAGCRILSTLTIFNVITGIVLISYASQLSSMIIFLPCYQIAILATNNEFKKFKSHKSMPIIINFVIVLTCFLFKIFFNKNTGIYKDYNKLIDVVSLHGVATIVSNLINFSSFLLIPFIVLIPSLTANSTEIKVNFLKSLISMKYRMVLLLLLVSVVPYVLVGKSASLFSYEDWEYRQALILSYPIALLTGLLYSLTYKAKAINTNKSLHRILVPSGILCLIFLLALGYGGKIQRGQLDNALVHALKKNVEMPKPNRINFISTSDLHPALRDYESNYISFRAYKRLNWWTEFKSADEDSSPIPSEIQNLPASEFLFRYQQLSNSCETNIKVGISGYEVSALKTIAKLFNKDDIKVIIKDVSSSCR